MGISSWVEIKDNQYIKQPVFTAECWVKVFSSGLIVTRDHPSGEPSDWQLWYHHPRRRLAFITAKSPPDLYFFTPDNSITPGKWTHIAVVANGPAGTARVYIDGVLVITPSFSPRQFDANTGLAWGGYYDNLTGAYLDGYMDECRYWN
ncbi:MAG: LamG domain-containing protein, partial [Chlorobi bacterium]|nr:LamG domain-containing protein [Chlorobiota bacterium]